MTPPGLSQRSRAAMTGASMPSSIPNPPSHSETITSTRFGRLDVGDVAVDHLDDALAGPFAAASSCASTAADVRSTA